MITVTVTVTDKVVLLQLWWFIKATVMAVIVTVTVTVPVTVVTVSFISNCYSCSYSYSS